MAAVGNDHALMTRDACAFDRTFATRRCADMKAVWWDGSW